MEDKEQKIKISFETNADDVGGKVDGLSKKLQGTTKETDNVATSQKKAAKSSKDLGQNLDGLGGPIGNAVSGFKALLKQMWAIVANPIVLVIVAIVGALALMFKAFTSTNEGADKLKQVMAGLSAVVDVLRDRFLKLISLDFKGAFGGVGDEISKEFKEAAKLAKSLQEVADATRDLGVSRSKLNRDLAEAKELITDETASYGDKKKAIDEVRRAEGAQTDQELANAKKKLKAIVDQNALSDTSDEDLQKQADAESALFNLQAEQATNKRAFNRLDKKADAEEKGRLKEITEAKTAAYKERLAKQKEAHKLEVEEQKRQNEALKALQKEKTDAEQNLLKFIQDLNDKTEEEKLARQKERANVELQVLKDKGINIESITRLNAEKFATLENELAQKRVEAKTELDRVATEKAAADKKEADEKALEEQKRIDGLKLDQARTIEDSKIQMTDKAIGLFGVLAGKNKNLQKAALIAESAVAIGRSITATSAANVAAVSAGAALAIPTGGASVAAAGKLVIGNKINAGLNIATIIASTATALGALGGGGGSGGSNSVPNDTGATPTAAPQVSFQGSNENQISNSINNQPPIQAFVVASQVTTAQQLANNQISSNSI